MKGMHRARSPEKATPPHPHPQLLHNTLTNLPNLQNLHPKLPHMTVSTPLPTGPRTFPMTVGIPAMMHLCN